MTAADIIAQLELSPHPEGGFFRETYRSADSIPASGLDPRYPGSRAISTAIYFLLTGDTFSAFHRLRSDEVWHFHAGDPIRLYLIYPDGRLEDRTVGGDLAAGHEPQVIIPSGCWFGARVANPDGFTLIGCTVAPGFDFADFELARRNDLIARFPQHQPCIVDLTRTP